MSGSWLACPACKQWNKYISVILKSTLHSLGHKLYWMWLTPNVFHYVIFCNYNHEDSIKAAAQLMHNLIYCLSMSREPLVPKEYIRDIA